MQMQVCIRLMVLRSGLNGDVVTEPYVTTANLQIKPSAKTATLCYLACDHPK